MPTTSDGQPELRASFINGPHRGSTKRIVLAYPTLNVGVLSGEYVRVSTSRVEANVVYYEWRES